MEARVQTSAIEMKIASIFEILHFIFNFGVKNVFKN